LELCYQHINIIGGEGGKERGEGRNRVRGEDGYRGYKGRGLL